MIDRITHLFKVNTQDPDEIYIWHQLMCRYFITWMIEERKVLFGNGQGAPAGVISLAPRGKKI